MGILVQPNALLKSGIAKISGGAQQYGVPTRSLFTSQSTSTLNINEDRYIPFFVDYPVTLNAWQLEVTTGPTGAANLRVGVYLTDTNMQPTGAPLYDSGSVAVAQSFTGVKTASSLSIALNPGVYLAVINCDTAMTIRTILTGTNVVAANLGTNAFVQRFAVSRSYAAFPNPGTAWTTISQGTGGYQHFISWQWTE